MDPTNVIRPNLSSDFNTLNILQMYIVEYIDCIIVEFLLFVYLEKFLFICLPLYLSLSLVLCTISGTTPGPEITDSSRKPRRRLCNERASNTSSRRGHQHQKMSGMENKTLSRGRGSDP